MDTANKTLTEYPGTRDEKGRRKVDTMTDRELLEEAVLTMRKTQDTVESFIADMARNPMLKMLAGKFGG